MNMHVVCLNSNEHIPETSLRSKNKFKKRSKNKLRTYKSDHGNSCRPPNQTTLAKLFTMVF